MSRSNHLRWVETIVFSTLVVLFKGVENATVFYENNPFFQNGVNPSVIKVPQILSSTPLPSKTNWTKPDVTIEPPSFQFKDPLLKFCLKPKGQFPSTSCNKYVDCFEGIVIEQKCPSGLLFNDVKLYCDYRENVDCKGRPTDDLTGVNPSVIKEEPQILSSTQLPSNNNWTKPDVTIEPPSLQFEKPLLKFCLKPKGQFPSTSCNKYVNCFEGIVIEQICPLGLFFNDVKLYCDYRENVDCKERLIDDPTGVNPLLRQFCLRSTGLFPGPACGKYVKCWNGNPVEYDCPPGLHFSSVGGFCDYPERVKCGEHKETVSESLEYNDCPLEFGTFRNRSDCSQYYTCAYSKVAAKFHCPLGFSFSDILGVCDYSGRVDCSGDPQIFQRISVKIEQDSLLSSNAFAHPDLLKPSDTGDIRCSTSYGFSRDRSNCSIYYVCEAGFVRTTHVCPPGYSFSSKLDRCDYSEKVDCTLPSLTLYNVKNYQRLLSSIPNDVLKKIQNCQPGSVFRLSPQCTTACRCQTHVAEIIQCAAGLAYDSKADKCLPNDVARC